MRSTTSWVSGLSLAACLLQSGCSVVTPEPLWELTKAVGGIAAISVGQSPPQASNTTYNLRTPVTDLCIEFNPRTQVPDFLPALQAELQARGVSSRVYDSPPAARISQCKRPTALRSSSSDRKEFEQTISAKSPVRWAKVPVWGRIS